MIKFTKIWYSVLALLLIAGCSGIFLGDRDTVYQGEKTTDISTLNANDWWASTVLLRKSNGEQWCSGVVINNTTWELVDTGKKKRHANGEMVPLMELVQISYVVTARHCSGEMRPGSTVEETYYNVDGSIKEEIVHFVLAVMNHPTKDFALLKVGGHARNKAQVYTGHLPTDRQDYIIGYRGEKYEDYHKLGKYISPAFAYKGQSGGGVFTPGYGLHSIVSTHVDGVNIYLALKEMLIDNVIYGR